MKTGDQFLVKQINKSIVLETVRHHSPISRSQVSEITGLNKGTVSSLVNELIESNLVLEIGEGKSSGGRKPLLLLFNHLAGYAIGVDIRMDCISLVLTDLQGHIVERIHLPLQKSNQEYVVGLLIEGIRQLMARTPSSPYSVVGIGVGVPGIVDEEGTVLFAPNLQWRDVPLQRWLTDEFGIPVVVDNEARAGAQGEKQFGAGQTSSNLIFLSVGHGIGTGIVLNRELYKGEMGFSGEAGHISIESRGEACSCGNWGCWELYASEKALLRQANKHEWGKKSLSLETLHALASNQDPTALALFEQIGEYLGIGLANMINIFNPELVVIGNRMALAAPWIEDAVLRTVEKRALPYHQKRMKIVFSHLGTDSTVLGAASFAVSQFFTKTRVLVD
ncbi:ROK family transcriptional regulator [Ammoniphilus sp. YIM 78166]|uniref:ROK family transcriptional regulator n=1 Tax=Ammoniphilus sp. YIM 78166 TaxID=1644106 RepID=UPI00106F0F5D|nr:ROK family transcriptional regulator [Ammoniphilus sp. YIM 78166]